MTEALVNLVEIRAAGALGSPKVDREAGIVHGVKILGRSSPNRIQGKPTRYSDGAIKGAVGLYEGAQVYVDHPPREAPNAERSYRDRFGRLEKVRATDDGLFGDLRVNKAHPLAEQFFWDAEHNAGGVGLSHNAKGVGQATADAFLIESIRSVRSVDVVPEPATTHSLFESLQQETPMATTAQQTPPAQGAPAATPAPAGPPSSASGQPATALEGKAGDAPAPDRVDLVEARLVKLEESLKAERAESDKLRVQLAARERKERVEALLVEAKLPDFAVTDTFRAQLLEAKDDAAVKALLEDRRRIAWHQNPNTRPAGDAGAKPIEDTAAAVEFLRKGGR